MTPTFAKVVDPIFLHMLRLLDRIEQNERTDAQEWRRDLTGILEQAQAKLGQSEQWNLAKYALCAWIDEVLINAPWPDSVWWANNLLEFEMFNTADAYHLFYERAKEAATLPVRDALEVFYIAVVLGFRGLYRDPGLARIEAEPRQLPHTLEDWAKHTVRGITFTEGPVIEPGGQMGAGAPPLDGLLWFTLSAAVTAALAALVTATFVFRMGWLPG